LGGKNIMENQITAKEGQEKRGRPKSLISLEERTKLYNERYYKKRDKEAVKEYKQRPKVKLAQKEHIKKYLSIPENAQKLYESNKRYGKTQAGKDRVKAYQQSEKGIAARERMKAKQRAKYQASKALKLDSINPLSYT
jgi:predicted metal-dependent phosphoesterase TrpH